MTTLLSAAYLLLPCWCHSDHNTPTARAATTKSAPAKQVPERQNCCVHMLKCYCTEVSKKTNQIIFFKSMAMGHILLWLFLFHASSADNEDLFSSTYELQRLHSSDVQFSRDLYNYANVLEQQLKDVKRYLRAAYPNGPLNETDNAEAYVSNPLNALGIMWRMGYLYVTHGMPHLMQKPFHEETRKKIVNDSRVFPTLENYRDAASSITLLQEAYQLNTTALAYGVIQVGNETKFTSDHTLNLKEVLELGTAACNRGWWDTGLEWYEVGIDKYKRGDDPGMTVKEVQEVQAKMKTAKGIHDQLLDKRGAISPSHRCYPLPFDEKLRKKKKYREARKNPKAKAVKVKSMVAPFSQLAANGAADLNDNFHELCERGRKASVFRSAAVDARLQCRLLHHNDPYLRLAPFKMEELSEQPFVIKLHDFMSDDEIRHFREYAVKNMYRSSTGMGQKSKTSLTRTSKQAWLPDKAHVFNITRTDGNVSTEIVHLRSDMTDVYELPANHSKYKMAVDRVAYRLSLRIQNATELVVTDPFSAEAYQVANYGMGGQYSTHLDPHGYYKNDSSIYPDRLTPYHSAGGDRFATFMIYLSDVDYGGNTVFPLAGLSSSPEMGSGIFWINLHPPGFKNEWTNHGGCPVLVGSKWITNKWIHYHDQFAKFPCGLNHSDKFHTLNKWR
jgi:prolyl 4-hydroxylase